MTNPEQAEVSAAVEELMWRIKDRVRVAVRRAVQESNMVLSRALDGALAGPRPDEHGERPCSRCGLMPDGSRP